jgi:hypothetical protein
MFQNMFAGSGNKWHSIQMMMTTCNHEKQTQPLLHGSGKLHAESQTIHSSVITWLLCDEIE